MKKADHIRHKIFGLCSSVPKALVTLFLITQFSLVNANQSPQQSDTGIHKMTVAKVFEKEEDGYTEIVFLESARFYKLAVTNKNYQDFLRLLKESEKTSTPLQIKFLKPGGDIIEQVRKIEKGNKKKKY